MLAAAFLARRVGAGRDGRPRAPGVGRRTWLRGVAGEVLAAYARPPRDRPRELAAYIAIVLEERPRTPRAARACCTEWLAHPATVRAPGRCRGSTRVGELAERSSSTRASSRGLPTCAGSSGRRGPKLRNYTYVRVPRAAGPPRVIERPKARLKEIQRAILRDILTLDPGPRRRARVRARALGAHARERAPRAAPGDRASISRTSSPRCPPRGCTGSSAPPAIRRPSRTR